MRIRRAIAADIPALMALEKHSATAAHWSAEQYQTAFSNETSSRVVLIVEDEAAAQGFILGKALAEEWEIENIVVAERARRHGLGTRLLGEFLNLAQGGGGDAVFLEVRESNLAARRLYEKRGFVQSGRRKLYYREPEEDAIVYRLNVASHFVQSVTSRS